ncbi:MAG: hypothetical protein CW691_05940 [Candidatus Bathyarchaeum sp.]|nr:MAG: hypothetical protein CW691_05940 [Candidatus Bathyarchaeum sp.]
MPLTPLHHPLAYFIYKLHKQLSLPGLIVGCMFPDLEIPCMVLFFGTQGPNRMVLHSILGAATIGTFLAVIVTVRIYPYIVSRLFHVDKQRVENKCKLSFALVFSVFVGILSHVLLDVTNHPYNPVFWPFSSATATQSPIYFAVGDPFGYLWIQIIMSALLVALIVVKRKNLFEELLVG